MSRISFLRTSDGPLGGVEIRFALQEYANGFTLGRLIQSMTPACLPLSPTFNIEVSSAGQLQFAAPIH
jgi:hypothetical protein